MSNDFDELTVQYEEDGQVLVEQMDKLVLNKGLWSTIVFLYRERDRKTGEFGPPKVGFRRYQKRGEYYIKKDAINLSAKNLAPFVNQVRQWFPDQE